MKPRDYDPDFTYAVKQRRHNARIMLLGYAFIVIIISALIGAVIAGINHLLRFL